MRMNKKGGEKWLSLWWFFVLAVVGGAIVIGVLIYYNDDVNVKEFESDILADRIVRCLTDAGYLRADFLEEDFDIYKECGLKKKIFDQTDDFYFDISIRNREGDSLREVISGGDVNIEKNCGIGESMIRAKHFPKCSYKEQNVLYYKNCQVEKAVLEVVAGSDQEVKKISIV